MDKIRENSTLSVAATAVLCLAAVTLLVVLGGVCYWLWGIDRTADWPALRQLLTVCLVAWVTLVALCLLGFIAARLLIASRFSPRVRAQTDAADRPDADLRAQLAADLRSRYGLFWRQRVRLLWVTGEASAVAALLPRLRAERWLEGQGIVLLDGGSLHQPRQPLLLALRSLRRWRPLDGIVLVQGSARSLTGAGSDNALRSLDKISAILRWQAPVWLWQLLHSDWPQPASLPAGTTFSAAARPEAVREQLEQLIPALREQGIARLAHNAGQDALLRLAQQLRDGGSADWQLQLVPWLSDRSSRSALRGLLFSLPSAVTETPALHPHALPQPAGWQNIADDRHPGQRRGLLHQLPVGHAFTALVLFLAAGLLLSFTVNRQQIASAAQQVQALSTGGALDDRQLIALQDLRNLLERQQQWLAHGAPWYQRFGLSPLPALHQALINDYGAAANRLLRDPAQQALEAQLRRLVALPPASPLRASLAEPGYRQLKAWLMLARPQHADPAFFATVMRQLTPQRAGVSAGLWQSVAPDLWAFHLSLLAERPGWAIRADPQLLTAVRQLLLQQLGRRNAESTLYQNLLQKVRRNYGDLTLEEMTPGTDARRLFRSSAAVPGMFTRQAWEGEVRQAIAKAAHARREKIDWVLSDSRGAASADVSPEALQARLTQRYFTDYAASWLGFLNGLRLTPVQTIADVTDQLTLIADARQSPLIALVNTLVWQGQAGRQREALAAALLNPVKRLLSQQPKPVIDPLAGMADGPLAATFGPLLALTGQGGAPPIGADASLGLQTFLTRVTRVRLGLQQVSAAAEPQGRLQALAQTVFQGENADLADARQYGSLMAASLGEEWGGFGDTVFVQPLTRAWQSILQPAAHSLNAQWRRAVADPWQNAFDGRYPFSAHGSDAALPMLAEFIRQDRGRIDRFLQQRLAGVLQQEGSRWVADGAFSRGLNVDPRFLAAVNQLRAVADILFSDGTQGISFALQGQPTPDVIETRLQIDGQTLRYFNQLREWQGFRWPGTTPRPGARVSWNAIGTGGQIYGDYAGSWGLIRWLEQSRRRQLDDSRWLLTFTTADQHRLQWQLQTQLGDGPLALLALRNFRLPQQIFSAGPGNADPALATDDLADDAVSALTANPAATGVADTTQQRPGLMAANPAAAAVADTTQQLPGLMTADPAAAAVAAAGQNSPAAMAAGRAAAAFTATNPAASGATLASASSPAGFPRLTR